MTIKDEKNEKPERKISATPAGLEPAILGLEYRCLVHEATGAFILITGLAKENTM